MNARERFLAVMDFEPGVTPLKWEYGYWAGTIRRWYEEGLVPANPVPASLGEADSVRAEAMGYKAGGFVDLDIHSRFGLDEAIRRIPVNNYLLPEFPVETLADHGDWLEYRDRWGILRHERKDHSSPPAFVRGPVDTLDDWHRLSEERLRPETLGRFPPDWDHLVAEYAARDYPLVIRRKPRVLWNPSLSRRGRAFAAAVLRRPPADPRNQPLPLRFLDRPL